MLRTLFLLLVIVGAFAAVFALVIGVGAMRMADPVPAAVSSGSSPQPVVTPGVSAPAAPPAMALLAPPAIAPASLPPAPPAAADAIVLAAEGAKLSGPRIRLYTTRLDEDGGEFRDDERGMGRQRARSRRLEGRRDEAPPPPVIRAWSQPQDVAGWTFEVPRTGQYAVTLVYTAGTASRRWTEGDEGGRFELTVGEEKFTGRVEPTGRGYRMVEVAKVSLAKGETTLQLRPAEQLGEQLMTLRSITLYPVP